MRYITKAKAIKVIYQIIQENKIPQEQQEDLEEIAFCIKIEEKKKIKCFGRDVTIVHNELRKGIIEE